MIRLFLEVQFPLSFQSFVATGFKPVATKGFSLPSWLKGNILPFCYYSKKEKAETIEFRFLNYLISI